MFYTLVWFLVAFFLFFICTKKRRPSQDDLPIYPLVSEVTFFSKALKWGGGIFFFFFCCLWASLFLESIFPSYTSNSWFFSSQAPKVEKQFPYSATLFIVDRSSSMKSPMSESESRLDFAKGCIQDIIYRVDKERKGKDVFGLMECARLSPLLVPMTRNRDFFFQKLQQIRPEEETKFNGTSLGYALFKGTFFLVALEKYAKKNNIEMLPRDSKSIVFITDGMEEVNPQDYRHPFRSLPFKEALQQARAFHIRVWYILIETFQHSTFPSFTKERIMELSESTGGGFIDLLPNQNKDGALERVSSSISASIATPTGMKQKPSNLLELKVAFLLLCLVGMRFSEFGRYSI